MNDNNYTDTSASGTLIKRESRTFNYTGRKRIRRRQVEVGFGTGDDGVYDGSIDIKIDIASDNFPDDAKVYVEATGAKGAYKRFDFGTTKQIFPPEDVYLPWLQNASVNAKEDIIRNTIFKVKVVDSSDGSGRLLGFADRLKPESVAGTELGLFKQQAKNDMGHRLWQLEFEEDGPIMYMNSDIVDNAQYVYRGSMFKLSVIPAVYKEILMHLFVQNRPANLDEVINTCPWSDPYWINFITVGVAKDIIGNDDTDSETDYENVPPEMDHDAIRMRVEKIEMEVDRFSQQSNFNSCWDDIVRSREGD